jgi:membrane fusion protein (multidrug efflux system)
MDGFVNAQIRAQVSGYLLKQDYQEGTQVKTGDVLFEIDPRPFQAALDQTLAKLAQDQAQQHKTELDVKRYTPLAQEQAVSQEELDNAVQANLAALAQVKADQAQVENAQLNLGFTKILSPIDGLAGIALAQIGDLLSSSSGLLTTVSTINPIKVYFNVSEQSYMDFWRQYTSSNESQPDLGLQLILSDGKPFPEKGKFYLADRQVNLTTGTLQIAGLFPNSQLLLRPGQYGRVRAETQVITNTVLLPQRAVAELQGTFQVVVVDDQKKAHLRPVTVGQQVGPNWVIQDGLHPGDQVVVEGTQQAKEGTTVNPKPWNPTVATNSPPPVASTNQAPSK